MLSLVNCLRIKFYRIKEQNNNYGKFRQIKNMEDQKGSVKNIISF